MLHSTPWKPQVITSAPHNKSKLAQLALIWEEGHKFWGSMEGCKLTQRKGAIYARFATVEPPLLLWLGATRLCDLGAWRQRSRQSGESTDIWEEARYVLCTVLSMQILLSSKIWINPCATYEWHQANHFLYVCIHKWKQGLSCVRFSLSGFFRSTPCHSK